MESGPPYLSIVATARNDNHGGDLLHRMQIFVDGILEQCRRHELPAELILVEWNPPADRPRLVEALNWPVNPFCDVRIIEVPPGLHAKFQYADRLPLFQMIAKNVGIRRAQGEFILATNVDILLSDEMMRWLASRPLQPRRLYRVNRVDVQKDVPAGVPLDERLAFCRNNVLRVNHRQGIDEYRCAGKMRPLMASNLRRATLKTYWIAFRLLVISYYLLQRHKYNQRIVNHTRVLKRDLGIGPAWRRLHLNACGDFTLLSKTEWEGLRGYPELEMFSMHLDSLFCYMAYHAGIKEVLLPHPLFHIDHEGGWSPKVERDQSLNKHLSEKQVARATDEQLEEWGQQMQRDQKPLLFNHHGWGLADERLSEKFITATEGDSSAASPYQMQ